MCGDLVQVLEFSLAVLCFRSKWHVSFIGNRRSVARFM